jgi:formate dehydrogenase subunit delta
MQPEKLVMMANQIAKFFAAQGHDRAVPQITDHLEKFWDPRMRRQIREHATKGGAGLDPLALEAVNAMKPVKSAA